MGYEYDPEDSIGVHIKHRLFHLSIREAAELAVQDMWESGELPDIEEPEDWDGDGKDPKIRLLLEDHIRGFEAKIFSAVDSGRLKAENITRDFDENLLEHAPRISVYDLDMWLMEHDYCSGDAVEQWKDKESEIHTRLDAEFTYLRASTRLPTVSYGTIKLHNLDALTHENQSSETLASACKALIIENDRLRKAVYGDETEIEKKRAPTADKPLTTKPRRTLLTIIAALCNYSDINHQERGVAVQIAGMTEEIGAAVDDGTIKKYLDEIPDALGTRMR